MFVKGKNMVKWFVFNILKNSNFTLAIIFNHSYYNYPLYLYLKLLIIHLINITRHVIAILQKVGAVS
jgi:hypothetical protein